jgi:hypothetical protein
VSAAGEEASAEGTGPFVWFGVSGALGAAFALFMGLEYVNTPTFDAAALPTILGVVLALIAFFAIGRSAPPNE